MKYVPMSYMHSDLTDSIEDYHVTFDEPYVEKIAIDSDIEEELEAITITDLCDMWTTLSQREFSCYIHGCIMFSGYSSELQEELELLRDIRNKLAWEEL